jgi:cardiolipin synthase
MGREGRVVTLPNAISVVRLACAPVFVWLLASDRRVAAVVLLGALGGSDWIDGYIARHFDQGSDIGKVLDPVADRVLLLTAAIALVVDGTLPIVVGVLVLAREAVVSTAVLALAAAGARRIDVQWAGKAGTLALMFALPGFLLADTVHGGGHDVVRVLAWVFTTGGLVLAYYAAVTYLPQAREALREGRAARAAVGARAGSVAR